MSRSITQDILDELQSGNYFSAFLFEFTDGSLWYRYTDLDVDVLTAVGDSTSEVTFSSRGFDFESIFYSIGNIVDSAVIKLDNLDQVFTSIFGGGEMQGQTARIYIIVFEDDGDVIGTNLLFEGEIDNFDLDENEIRVSLGSYFAKWSHKSSGKHSASCRWKVFKGTECQYAGAGTWCDRTYSRCVDLSNTINFGGFRFLPDLENKTLWWGPIPSERRAEG